MANSSVPRPSRTVLHSTDAFEIVTFDWSRGSTLAAPTNGSNQNWLHTSVLVQEGRFESHLDLGLNVETSTLEKEAVATIPVGATHTLTCVSESGRTLHVFTSKISKPKTTGLNSDRKFSTPTLSQLKSAVDLKLSSEPSSWHKLEESLKNISKHSVSTESPYFMNQLFSGVFPETAVSETVIHRHRTTLATFEASPVFTAIELEVVDRLCELIGWDEKNRDGVGVPGGSAANIMALHVARHRARPEYRKHGSSGEKLKIFVSKSAHYSLKKACLATGFGTDALVPIAVDSVGRMKVDELGTAIEASRKLGEIPLLVCATSGTTVRGAFDPIDKIADLCKTFSLWLHVDAAWGGPVLFSAASRGLMDGVQQADSVTFDAHKLFGSRLTSSFFLTKHRGLLLDANDAGGEDYLFHSDTVELDRGRSSWQCGRGAEALSFWSLWKHHGTIGLGHFVDRLMKVQDESVRWIKDHPKLTLVSEPTYLNLCVRIKSDDREASLKAREKMKADDFAFVNFSTDDEGPFLRLILAHPKVDFPLIRSILTRALEQ